MKSLPFFLLISISLSFISCGSSRDNLGVNKSFGSNDLMWGEPLELTPKNKKDFEKNWVVKAGTWEVIDGKLETVPNEEGNEEYIILFKKNRIGDYAIEFKARVKNKEALDAGGDLSIIMSSDEKLKYRYDLQIGGLGNTMAIIQMYNLPLAQVGYEVIPSEVYKIRAEKIGDMLKLYCNDVLIITCKNSYFLTGRFNGIYSYGKGKEFWDIKFFKKNMSDYEIELKAIDHILSKVIGSPAKHRQYADLVKKLFQDILNAYPENLILHDRIYLRIAHLELTLGNYKEVDNFLDRMNLKDNEYDISILTARANFMKGDYKKSKQLLEKCLKNFPFYRVGTIGVIKDLLYSKYSRRLSVEYQDFFWSKYVRSTLEDKINCSSANLKNIDFLKVKKHQIKNIVADNNSISSIAVLKDFPSLNALGLSGNELTSLKELNGLSVKSLSINSNKVSSLEGIKLQDLKSLRINHKNLTDLKLLTGCTNLEVLSGEYNQLRSLSSLESLKALRNVNLGFNAIVDISAIQLDNLASLSIQNNKILNIDSLSNSNKLVSLNIANNNISSIEALSKIESLETLICYRNPINSLGAFLKNPPKSFFFNIKLFSEKHIDEILEMWSTDELQYHKKNVTILMELKKGEKANIKQFAIKSNGHFYLSIPVFLNKKNAKAFCKKFGGHLISIVDKEELDEKILNRMPYGNYWIGLEEVNGSIKWSTNESVGIDQIAGKRWYRNTDDKSYSMVMENRWQVMDPDRELPFIIEWDR